MNQKSRSCAAVAGRFLILVGVFASSSLPAQTPPPAAPAARTSPTVYSSAGSLGGVTFTVIRLKRNANGSLTMGIRLQGTPGKTVDTQAIGFTQTYSPTGERPLVQAYKILDFANKKRYEMLVDSDGNCLCTHLTDQEFSDLSAGKSKDINIKFPAPPADVTSVTVELPHAEPIDDIPITN